LLSIRYAVPVAYKNQILSVVATKRVSRRMDVRCTKRLNTKTALKHAATDAKMLIGESAVTAAPFLERVRDDHPNPFGGPSKATG